MLALSSQTVRQRSGRECNHQIPTIEEADMQWTLPANTPKEAITKVCELLRLRANIIDSHKITVSGKHREQVVEARAKELRDFATFLENEVKVESTTKAS